MGSIKSSKTSRHFAFRELVDSRSSSPPDQWKRVQEKQNTFQSLKKLSYRRGASQGPFSLRPEIFARGACLSGQIFEKIVSIASKKSAR